MNFLHGKTALITGSGRGLGSHVALALAQDGLRVVINYRTNRSAAEKTAERIHAQGAECLLVQADVRRPQEVERLVSDIQQQTGRIDILIHAVGDFAQKPLLQTDHKLWCEMLESNLTSAFLMCRAVVPIMQKHKWGRIITIGLSSAAVIRAYREITPYAIAKTGLLILTQSLAHELAAEGITANCISLGHMRDGSTAPTIDENTVPMQRLGTAEDLMAAIRFLISEQAAYTSGSNILVSGAWGL